MFQYVFHVCQSNNFKITNISKISYQFLFGFLKKLIQLNYSG